jgi:hypothetical protein
LPGGFQIVKRLGTVDHLQLVERTLLDVGGIALRAQAAPDAFGLGASK